MQFELPPRRSPPESIVPMINVVFLLLIFFLMTAQITPPDPLEVSPPTAELKEPSEADLTLYIGADGVFALDDMRGEAALTELFGMDPSDPTLTIKADASVNAGILAALLPRIAGAGIKDITLITAAP